MRTLKRVAVCSLGLVVSIIVFVMYSSSSTEEDIARLRARVANLAAKRVAPDYDPAGFASLPEPVKRYFAFVFRGAPPPCSVVRLKAEGTFRRPLTHDFAPTTAEQVIAVGTPSFVFSATTPILMGLWARAYDFFAAGQMEMKARLLSTLTVVDECESPKLNRISLRRWLLESALYPQSLLPGGPTVWEPIDANSARATARVDGLSASMIAHFDAEGRMISMTAEEDGDLTTPYHGSGEHVTRGDYRLVGSQMIPHSFTISRAAAGNIYPFWQGRITSIDFQNE